MPSVYQRKPLFQNLLRPLAGWLTRRGVTANQVTLCAFVLSVAAGAAIAWRPQQRWPQLLLPVVLLARTALSPIDGMLAREYAMKTALGALRNELGDVLSDAAFYLPTGFQLKAQRFTATPTYARVFVEPPIQAPGGWATAQRPATVFVGNPLQSRKPNSCLPRRRAATPHSSCMRAELA